MQFGEIGEYVFKVVDGGWSLSVTRDLNSVPTGEVSIDTRLEKLGFSFKLTDLGAQVHLTCEIDLTKLSDFMLKLQQRLFDFKDGAHNRLTLFLRIFQVATTEKGEYR